MSSLNGPDAPVRWLDEEFLPEITLLDVTCDTALPGSIPATPVTAGSIKSRFTFLQPSQLSPSTDLNTAAQIPSPQKKTLDLPKAESEAFDTEPSRQNGTKTFSETSSSGDAQENNSEVDSSELSKQNRTASTFPDEMMIDPPESMYAPVRWLDVRFFPEITLLEVTRESELSHVGELSSMEDTHESILENSRPSLEPTGSNMEKIQTSAEETFDTQPTNVTQDMTSSSVVSVQSAASQFSTSDTQCNTSSKTVTSELHGEPLVTANTVEANDEEPPTSQDAELTSKETQPSPKTSMNSTLNSLQPSQLSSSTDLNTTAQIPCPQNTTLDIPTSIVNSPKAESEATDRPTSVSKNTTETSLVINENLSAVKAGTSYMPNITFDRHSLHKSSANTFLGDAGAGTFCLQNNTFDTKAVKQNGTITLSETSSSDVRQKTFDKSTPLEVCDSTSSPKEKNSEAPPPENNGTLSSTEPNTKMVDTPESTFEVNPAVDVASGAVLHETKDQSQSSLPLTDGLSDTQNMDTENNKGNTFNLDDTLDLRADILITSTPMTTCKIVNINTQREEGKTPMVQKKLYGDGPSKPDGQLPSDVPSNIACDRKTFFTHPAVKSLLPHSRAASQLLRHKPASTLPGGLDVLTSGLPMTRQRTQAEALRNTAAPDATQTTGISTSYKLRASTTGSKQPNSGLQRPQLSGIPSGIQRAATGLRPPSARSNAAASSSTNRLRRPTATTNPVTKTSQAKKQPLSRDIPVPSNCTDASISSCDAANGAKTLKQSTTSRRALPAKTKKDDAAASTSAEISTSCDALSRPRALKQPATSHRAPLAKAKSHDCANCVMLEQQLKMQSEEMQRLKEELLKKSKQEEEEY
ncbi:uncharacterized protein LOC129091467 isoform X2 [Anoplopoma fimbria]|uniref:uncharacterized protein LOC129091467 isoform X2 n=1 Tax=Anoplopoma fimbria TaxID=229290 RepID=UPI0023ECBED2|nr:uncharacterized protein LOC129091467 isoform X2 [Anoplopoma fimbria]